MVLWSVYHVVCIHLQSKMSNVFLYHSALTWDLSLNQKLTNLAESSWPVSFQDMPLSLLMLWLQAHTYGHA